MEQAASYGHGALAFSGASPGCDGLRLCWARADVGIELVRHSFQTAVAGPTPALQCGAGKKRGQYDLHLSISLGPCRG